MRGVRLAGAPLAIALLAGCSAVANYPIIATVPGTSCGGPPHKGLYIGVTAPAFPPSTVNLTRFENATGIHPSLIAYHSRFGGPFEVNAACYAAKHGAIPIIQIDPATTSLTYIADGKYDPYLRTYAAKVKTFYARLIISFGHEMNGNWYPWGWTHTSASVFVAAWRRIVNVFRSEGADNVTWLWTIDALGSSRVASPRPWWPGGDYVTWVGIDAYYLRRSQTFKSLLNSTISAVRHITHDPVLLAETGVAPAAGKAGKIMNLFAGIHAYGFLGLVWFDAGTKPDWRLEIAPTAAAVFGREAKMFGQ